MLGIRAAMMSTTDLTERATGRVRVSVARTLGQFVLRYPKLAIHDVLASVEIEPRRLANPDEWVDVRRVVALLDAFAIAANDDAFSLAFAQQVPWSDIGVLAHLAFNSPTLGSALANACRYLPLETTGAATQLLVEGRDAHIVYALTDPTIAMHAQNTQLVLGLYVRLCRDALGDPRWVPRAVHIRDPRPRNAAAHAALFGCPVRFGQSEDAIVLAPHDLRTPLVRADATLFEIVREKAEASLRAERVDVFHRRLQRSIGLALRSGDATVEQIAMDLGTSARTLQRRLQEGGRSFTDVVAQVRLALSRRYLRDPRMSLTDVAMLLGYSELSAFSRAFRRWTGRSARDYRRATSDIF